MKARHIISPSTQPHLSFHTVATNASVMVDVREVSFRPIADIQEGRADSAFVKKWGDARDKPH